MSAKVFLSLSFVDAIFVAEVRQRLPTGLAYFYQESFENGKRLLEEMERTVQDALVFILFASKPGQQSPWVGFEIDQARLQQIQRKNHRILVFPTDSEVGLSDLPQWLRNHWVARAGWSASDIARYITGVLLEPNVGVSPGAVRVIGRGKTLDKLEQITADNFARTRVAPNVYFLTGFRGVGRRTFASYYIRNALAADANLVFGPTLPLSGSADLVDLFQALRTEISPVLPTDVVLKERQAFEKLSLESRITEIVRLIGHFSSLGQAVTFVSAGGFFEDRGDPKDWVVPLLSVVPKTATVFMVSNRQMPPEVIQSVGNVVQMRIDELDDKDIRALMIRTAERLRVQDFSVSDELVRAIGGHADVANAAVRLSAIKGVHILERDPRQLFNIQTTILGENIEGNALTETQKKILSLLSWVPGLNGEANAQLNGKRATVKVLVTSDFEHKCFNINLEIVQTILHQIATLLQSEEVKTARSILVDLGVIGGSSGLGLLGYLKWKKSTEVEAIIDSDRRGIVIVQLGNGNFANVSQDAIALADNPKIRSALEGVLAPLGTDGIRKISFKEGDKEFATLDDEGAKEVLAAFSIPDALALATDEEPDTVTGWLRVYSPVYDERADKWRFFYGENPIYADISDTSIAHDAIARGGAMVNDLYKVKMEVQQHLTAGGNVRLDYKIVDVLDFKPTDRQSSLPLK